MSDFFWWCVFGVGSVCALSISISLAQSFERWSRAAMLKALPPNASISFIERVLGGKRKNDSL